MLHWEIIEMQFAT